MNPFSDDFYERLGIARTAPASAIALAYRRARWCVPGLSVEEFRRVQEAFDTLGDAGVRDEYDAGIPAPIAETWHAGLQALAERKLIAAETLLQLVVIEHPELRFARNLLGRCMLYGARPAEALAEFDRLLAGPDPAAAWWANAAQAQRASGRLAQAEHALTRAIALSGSGAALHYLALANVLAERGDADGAADAVREAISADDAIGVRDPALALELLELSFRAGDTTGVERELERALRLADAPESRRWAAARLVELAREIERAGRTVLAGRLRHAAQPLDAGSAPAPTAAPFAVVAAENAAADDPAMGDATPDAATPDDAAPAPAATASPMADDASLDRPAALLAEQRTTGESASVSSLTPWRGDLTVPARPRAWWTRVAARLQQAARPLALLITALALLAAVVGTTNALRARALARARTAAAASAVPSAPPLSRAAADSLALARLEHQLAELDAQIAVSESGIATFEERLDTLRASRAGVSAADNELAASVAEHTRLLRLYDQKVARRRWLRVEYDRTLAQLGADTVEQNAR